MTETKYHYVRGVGWVPECNTADVRFVNLGDGRRFRLTLRKSLPGERVMQISVFHDTLLCKDHSAPDMDKIVDWFMVKRPRLRSFYLVPPNGYRHGHFTIVVENAE